MKRVLIEQSKAAILAGTAILGVLSISACAPNAAGAAQVAKAAQYQEETNESLSAFPEESKPEKGWYSDPSDGKWYYIKDNVYVTGWLELNDKWFYFDEQGAMVNDTTLKINGIEYTFSKQGDCTNKE